MTVGAPAGFGPSAMAGIDAKPMPKRIDATIFLIVMLIEHLSAKTVASYWCVFLYAWLCTITAVP
jgi:hypothetical protein